MATSIKQIYPYTDIIPSTCQLFRDAETTSNEWYENQYKTLSITSEKRIKTKLK